MPSCTYLAVVGEALARGRLHTVLARPVDKRDHGGWRVVARVLVSEEERVRDEVEATHSEAGGEVETHGNGTVGRV